MKNGIKLRLFRPLIYLLGGVAIGWTAHVKYTVLDRAIYRQDEAQKSVDILRKHGAKTLSETDRLSN